MRPTCATFSILLTFAAATLSAAELPPPITATDLERAQLLANEGDLHTALSTALRVLREGQQEELREAARQQLRQWGLTPQELLSLDPEALKPADLNTLCDRTSQAQLVARRQGLELNYCDELLQAAVCVRRGVDGQFTATISDPDLARALNGFVQVAFSQPTTEHTEEAQRRLEQLGCVGARLEATRKAAIDGKLPEEVRREVAASVCLRRLQQYQEWLGTEGDEEDVKMRKGVARQLGQALFQFCDKQYSGTAACQRDQDALNAWRVPPQAPQNF